MASILKEILVNAPADVVWSAIRDVGAVHERLVPGLVTAVQPEDGARVVTFANGIVVRERIISIDDGARRFAYSAVGGRTQHHNASMQVVPDGESCSRVLWYTDFLPDEAAGPVRALVDHGSVIMKQTLERSMSGRGR